MIVYIVTSGEYSSYSIDAVYTDKEVADKLKELDFHVEEWNADVEIDKFKQGYITYSAYSWIDDDRIALNHKLPSNVNNRASIYEVIDWEATKVFRQNKKPDAFNQEPIKRMKFETWLLARNDEEATKIAAERKAKLVYAYNEHGQTKMEF